MELLLALTYLGLVGSVVAAKEFVVPIELDYHNAIGIPTAARIKAAEEMLDFDNPKIVGGSPAKLGQYSFFGGLLITLNTGNYSVCGSSLLSNTRAVTAAHCVRTKKAIAAQFTIVLGSTRLYSGGTRVTTNKAKVYPNYNVDTLANDVGIIGFKYVTYTDNIHAIEFASGTDQFVGTLAWAVGFGLTSDSSEIEYNQSLREVSVQVITNAKCKASFGTSIQDSNLCVATDGGHGTCSGDSGGPLVANGKLIGITSFGDTESCERGSPEVFSRVTAFASWIQEYL